MTTLSQSSYDSNAGRFIRISVKDGDCFADQEGQVYMARWHNDQGKRNLRLETDSKFITVGAFQHVFDALGLTRCKED